MYVHINKMIICLKRESNTRFKRSSGMERRLGGSSQGYIYLLKTDIISSAKQEQVDSSNLNYFVLLLFLLRLLLLPSSRSCICCCLVVISVSVVIAPLQTCGRLSLHSLYCLSKSIQLATQNSNN